MGTQLKRHSGKALYSTGKINSAVAIAPDVYDYLERAGYNGKKTGSLTRGIDRVVRFCMEHIPVEEFLEEG